MTKKADANMWWIIIGAVITLVVLVILMVIFTSKVNPLERGLSSCEGNAGLCVNAGSGCPSSSIKTTTFGCTAAGKECCLGTPKKCKSPAECGGESKSCRSEGTAEQYCYS